jgi:hypothetical protein
MSWSILFLTCTGGTASGVPGFFSFLFGTIVGGRFLNSGSSSFLKKLTAGSGSSPDNSTFYAYDTFDYQ